MDLAPEFKVQHKVRGEVVPDSSLRRYPAGGRLRNAPAVTTELRLESRYKVYHSCMSESRMTIGELARRARLPGSTIRYYERVGLVRSVGRTAGNYRYFEPAVIDRLHFIRAAQASGLSLDDVRALLQFQDGIAAPCKEVRTIIQARLDEVSGQMRHLRHVQRVLKHYRDACERTTRSKACPVLVELATRKQ